MLDVSLGCIAFIYNNKMLTLSVINKKIKVLQTDTYEDPESLSSHNNRLIHEEEKKQNSRSLSDNLERRELRKRKSIATHVSGGYNAADCILNCICFCSKPSK